MYEVPRPAVCHAATAECTRVLLLALVSAFRDRDPYAAPALHALGRTTSEGACCLKLLHMLITLQRATLRAVWRGF